MASAEGLTEIVMLLLKNKRNINVTDMWGNTPLIWAAQFNNMDTVRALVEAGCDITIRGYQNKTAAEWAQQMGHQDIKDYLSDIRLELAVVSVATLRERVPRQRYDAALAARARALTAPWKTPCASARNSFGPVKWERRQKPRDSSWGGHRTIMRMSMGILRCTWCPILAARRP